MKKITKLDRPRTSIDRIFGDLLFDDMFVLFPSHLGSDISSLDDQYVIKMEVPGYSENNIKIDLKNNMLQLSGEVKIEEDGFVSDKSFSKQWTLPNNVETDKIAATIKNGILTVRIPKTEDEKSLEKSIPVKQLDK